MCARPRYVLAGEDGTSLRWNEHIEGDGETIFRHDLQAWLGRH
jgi:hypothetical protein